MDATRLGRIALWVVSVGLAVVALLFWLERMRQHDPEIVLRSYEVPAEISSEVRSTLEQAFWQGQVLPPLGRVTMLPNGDVLVTAPEKVQEGVKRILDEVADKKPGPTPSIHFDLWVVTATTGADAPIAGDLSEIEPALTALRQSKGAVNFQLLEKLSTLARAGEESDIRGAAARMEVNASLRKDDQGQPTVAAKVEIQVMGGIATPVEIEARTEMRPGELLVIGQSAVTDPRRGAGVANAQIYYILRARL